MTALPVHRRHVDVEQPEKTVRLVFRPCRLAFRRPGYACRDRRIDSEVSLASEVLHVDTRAPGERTAEFVLCPNLLPLLREENDECGGKELL